MRWPERATVIDVGLRDGLQIEKKVVPTEGKVELLGKLKAAGIRRLQVISFVHPRWVPQMADAEQFVAAIGSDPAFEYSALVPNERGYERALAAGIRSVEFIISASDAFSRHNVNMGREAALAQCEQSLARARRDGARVRVGLTASFVCPFEGKIPIGRVVDLASRVLDQGAEEVAVADTSGDASPDHVYDLFDQMVRVVPAERITAHLHDTWGRGLANVVASLEAGVTAFDASIGGLGGCPFSPGAAGNIATEGLVAMLDGMGVRTGVDLDRLMGASELAQRLVERPLDSPALKAWRGRRARKDKEALS